MLAITVSETCVRNYGGGCFIDSGIYLCCACYPTFPHAHIVHSTTRNLRGRHLRQPLPNCAGIAALARPCVLTVAEQSLRRSAGHVRKHQRGHAVQHSLLRRLRGLRPSVSAPHTRVGHAHGKNGDVVSTSPAVFICAWCTSPDRLLSAQHRRCGYTVMCGVATLSLAFLFLVFASFLCCKEREYVSCALFFFRIHFEDPSPPVVCLSGSIFRSIYLSNNKQTNQLSIFLSIFIQAIHLST